MEDQIIILEAKVAVPASSNTNAFAVASTSPSPPHVAAMEMLPMEMPGSGVDFDDSFWVAFRFARHLRYCTAQVVSSADRNEGLEDEEDEDWNGDRASGNTLKPPLRTLVDPAEEEDIQQLMEEYDRYRDLDGIRNLVDSLLQLSDEEFQRFERMRQEPHASATAADASENEPVFAMDEDAEIPGGVSVVDPTGEFYDFGVSVTAPPSPCSPERIPDYQELHAAKTEQDYSDDFESFHGTTVSGSGSPERRPLLYYERLPDTCEDSHSSDSSSVNSDFVDQQLREYARRELPRITPRPYRFDAPPHIVIDMPEMDEEEDLGAFRRDPVELEEIEMVELSKPPRPPRLSSPYRSPLWGLSFRKHLRAQEEQKEREQRLLQEVQEHILEGVNEETSVPAATKKRRKKKKKKNKGDVAMADGSESEEEMERREEADPAIPPVPAEPLTKAQLKRRRRAEQKRLEREKLQQEQAEKVVAVPVEHPTTGSINPADSEECAEPPMKALDSAIPTTFTPSSAQVPEKMESAVSENQTSVAEEAKDGDSKLSKDVNARAEEISHERGVSFASQDASTDTASQNVPEKQEEENKEEEEEKRIYEPVLSPPPPPRSPSPFRRPITDSPFDPLAISLETLHRPPFVHGPPPNVIAVPLSEIRAQLPLYPLYWKTSAPIITSTALTSAATTTTTKAEAPPPDCTSPEPLSVQDVLIAFLCKLPTIPRVFTDDESRRCVELFLHQDSRDTKLH